MGQHRPSAPDLLERLDARLARCESIALVLVVLVMIALAAVQLVLRKLFDLGFEWADIIIRQMVLWLGFLGGALATHEGRHIAIDAVSRFLHAKHAAAARALTSSGAVLVALLLVYASLKFLANEVDGGANIFGDVPAWPFEAIIPLAFLMISFHFFVAARRDVLVALGRRPPHSESGGEHGPSAPEPETAAPRDGGAA